MARILTPPAALRGLRGLRRSGHHHFVMNSGHISDYDLERYYLGMIRQEVELAPLEEHILGCPLCAERVEEAQDYVDVMRNSAYQKQLRLRCGRHT